MSHIILITYSGYLRIPSSLAVDNGLASLAGSLISAGHDVLIKDYNSVSTFERMTPKEFRNEIWRSKIKHTFQENDQYKVFTAMKPWQEKLDLHQNQVVEEIFLDISDSIKKHKTTVVGFKCWLGDGLEAIKKWCLLLKANFPNISIILGGPACEIAPEHTAAFIDNFDVMVVGEGEKALVSLMEGKGLLSDINILTKSKTGFVRRESPHRVSFDELSSPVYDSSVYEHINTDERLNFIVVDESRGCPMKCHFCAHPNFSGQRRVKKVEKIVKEMKTVQEKLGTTFFRFAGSNTPVSLMRDLSNELIRQEIKIKFSCFMHAQTFKIEYLEAFYQAGLRSVFFGIESGDEDVLWRSANKKINLNHAKEVIKRSMEHQIFVAASFIFPLPYETKESANHTSEFISHVFSSNKLGSAVVMPPCPFPNTVWWDKRKEFGFEFEDEEYLSKGITYKNRNMYPPKFQDHLPLKLNGKSFPDMLDETSDLVNTLVKNNINVNISDDTAMIAFGCGEEPATFQKKMSQAFLMGNVEAVSDMVSNFNQNTRYHGL